MKMTTFTFLKHKTYLFSFIVLMLVSILSALPAYSQVDYYYGRNNSGFRFGIGGGVSMLNAHYTSNPPSPVFTSNLDYDINPYFSIGIEGQFGQLVGKDPLGKQYYSSSTDSYAQGNFNFRVSIGAFNNYETFTGLQDAIKRLYIGAGIGFLQTNIKYGPHTSAAVEEQPAELNGHFPVIPINIGTNINLPGVLGLDKLELNPNYQYDYANTTYLDGIGPSKFSKVSSSGYGLISLSLKYKF
jgi:hypothetical protein